MLISQLFNAIIIGHGLRRGFPFIKQNEAESVWGGRHVYTDAIPYILPRSG